MASDNGFSKKQLEQLQGLLQPINDRLGNLETKVDKVESRLDVLETKVDRIEKDIKDMKSTPTMKRELKQSSK